MTTLTINTTKTMTYNAEESARAFAVIERMAALAVSAWKLFRRAFAGRAPSLHTARA